MKFLIVTLAPTLKKSDGYYSYAPYVYEMNLWNKHVDELAIVSPISYNKKLLVSRFENQPKVFPIASFSFMSISEILKSILNIPGILYRIYKAMKWADHIHLRCPGNIGLLGCMVQVLFPKKKKTIKYAGNWDPNSKQPRSYKLQQWLLKNTFLTKNAKVLVYGNWNDTSKNIVPFFTASYSEKEKQPIADKCLDQEINLLFVGTLSEGKQPLLSVKVAHEFVLKGHKVCLDIYGDGVERRNLELYIKKHNLSNVIKLHGNKDKNEIKAAYKKAHFLVFISKSEGWPKVVAEAMFWKCLPISTSVSCVSDMLDNGNRGSLVNPDVTEVIAEIAYYKKHPTVYRTKINKALTWSRTYTLEKFEENIKDILVEY